MRGPVQYQYQYQRLLNASMIDYVIVMGRVEEN